MRTAQRWSARELSFNEQSAIETAAARGDYWLARLLEREARGRFVESRLNAEFPQLRWSKVGVDAVDPRTGCYYEILSGTDSNLALHGQRMAGFLFRMITF
ncbi:hypothetical protein K8638_40560 [Myxococcus sp. RHST-1-4]|nr:hypothetical protein [Myxococcus sp. RHSTA-1-4]